MTPVATAADDGRVIGRLEGRLDAAENRIDRLEANLTASLATVNSKLDLVGSQLTSMSSTIAAHTESRTNWRFLAMFLVGGSGWALIFFDAVKRVATGH